MYPEDYKDFLHIIELIEEGKLDKTIERCFITGVLAGLNYDLPEVYEYLDKILQWDDNNEIDALIETVETFED